MIRTSQGPFWRLSDADLADLARDGAGGVTIPAACLDGVIEVLRGLRDHARIVAAALPEGAKTLPEGATTSTPETFEP